MGTIAPLHFRFPAFEFRVVEVETWEEVERLLRRVVSVFQTRFESLRHQDEASATHLLCLFPPGLSAQIVGERQV